VNFSAWAIRKPTPSILLFIMISVAGLIAFRNLGVQYMPDMDFPGVIVSASLPGAGPEQIEAEVVRHLEDSISTITGVRHFNTTINDGNAQIFIDFAIEKNLQEALTDVRDAVTRVRAILPSDLQEPVVSRVDYSGLAVLTYAVIAPDMDEADLSWFVDDSIGKRLLQERGVAQIRRHGGVNREVRVELNPLRLQSLGVTAGEISSQLRRMQQEAPGGRGNLSGLEQSVRTLGTVSSAAELGQVSLPLMDGRRIRLADVADVRDTYAERRSLALLDGKKIVSFEVVRARGSDEVSTAKRVRAAVEKLQEMYPRVKLIEIGNSVEYAQSEFNFAMQMLLEGAILAVIVVWLFLRDWRATFISAVALPLSIIPTFLVLSLFGYTLNTLTLLALTLVIGILVDDAIVEVENIMRHLQMGKPPKQAAMEAADEIGLAVIATSLTLVSVFLPTAFTGGITGVFFRQFGVTAAAAVLFSLLVARLLTPMMSAYLLKAPTHPHTSEPGPLMSRYLNAVRWCLDHPGTTLGAATALFFASLLLISQLPLAYVSAEDNTTELVTLDAPPGSTLEQTAALADQARVVLQGIPEIATVYTAIGSGVQANDSFDAVEADVRSAKITVTFKDKRDRKLVEVRRAMREELTQIPGVRIGIGRGRPGEKMVLMLNGDDPPTLRQAAIKVETELRTLKGIGGVTSSASLRRPEIVIRPDFARAAELGVTSAAIGQAVHVATTGDYDFNLPRMNLPGRQVFVRVLLDPSSRRDPEMIAQLRVMGDNGAAIPLGNIAQIAVADGPAQIDRYDRHRYVRLEVELQGRPVGDVLKEAQALPSLQHLPPGVSLTLSGDIEGMNEMLGEFSLAMIAGVFCVYAVMVLLFHDFGQPLTVLAALPLASAGALGLMWVFGFALSMSSLLGLLILIGIVSKNSILLVDYAIMARNTFGMSRADAMIDACHKRARPILMTTVAMGAGMLPIAFGVDGEDTFRAPMAVVVIGGLITSTILSLLVVPVVFVIVDKVKSRIFPQAEAKAQPEPLSTNA
jgi:hydrophobe/amphiphile efflux-1 (HAE1) family protein